MFNGLFGQVAPRVPWWDGHAHAMCGIAETNVSLMTGFDRRLR